MCGKKFQAQIPYEDDDAKILIFRFFSDSK